METNERWKKRHVAWQQRENTAQFVLANVSSDNACFKFALCFAKSLVLSPAWHCPWLAPRWRILLFVASTQFRQRPMKACRIDCTPAAFGRRGAQPTQHQGRCALCFAAQAGSDSQIENLPDICDDFQCNSSPQVEQHIRSFAKDIERHSKWTVTLFALEVQFRVRP